MAAIEDAVGKTRTVFPATVGQEELEQRLFDALHKFDQRTLEKYLRRFRMWMNNRQKLATIPVSRDRNIQADCCELLIKLGFGQLHVKAGRYDPVYKRVNIEPLYGMPSLRALIGLLCPYERKLP